MDSGTTTAPSREARRSDGSAPAVRAELSHKIQLMAAGLEEVVPVSDQSGQQ